MGRHDAEGAVDPKGGGSAAEIQAASKGWPPCWAAAASTAIVAVRHRLLLEIAAELQRRRLHSPLLLPGSALPASTCSIDRDRRSLLSAVEKSSRADH